MPELCSGTRQARLKAEHLDDIQQISPLQPFDQVENWPLLTQNITVNRAGAGRVRGGNAAGAAKVASVTPVWPSARGRGIKLIDLDLEQPCELLPEVDLGRGKELELFQTKGVAGNKLENEVGSAEKLIGVEEAVTADPTPEREKWSKNLSIASICYGRIVCRFFASS